MRATPLRRPAALVFDLDGTLIDSRRDIATAINRTRAGYGLPPLTLDQVVGMVGEGARVLIERALRELPAEKIDEALGIYLEHYREVSLDTTLPYEGTGEMLERLQRVYPLALLSNKSESLSRHILEHLGLAGRFRAILGGDSFPTRKPDPEGLRKVAGLLGAEAANLMLIGDSRIDAETARNAGALFGLVEWGFPRTPGSEELQADLRAASPRDLGEQLLALAAG
jgi:phosphoglycolate phosphatase